MASEREIALDQALVAVFGAAKDLGYNIDELKQKASGLVMGHSAYRRVEHPHVSNAVAELEAALIEVKGK